MYDIAIVGTGPAGLTTASYACRRGLDVLMFEAENVGGELVNRDEVRGYPGFPDGVAGPDLRSKLVSEVERYDPEVQLATVEEIEPGSPHTLRTGGGEYEATAVVVATGGSDKHLDVPGEEEYRGMGVFYCAKCDGPLYRGETIAVVGGNNHAVTDALFLSDVAERVVVIESEPTLPADEYLRQELQADSNVDVETGTEVREIEGSDGVLESVLVADVEDGTERTIEAGGLFAHVGIDPNTGFLEGTVPLAEDGSAIVDGDLETEVDGIFAAGDVRQGSPQEVAAATGDGVAAAKSAIRYVEDE